VRNKIIGGIATAGLSLLLAACGGSGSGPVKHLTPQQSKSAEAAAKKGEKIVKDCQKDHPVQTEKKDFAKCLFPHGVTLKALKCVHASIADHKGDKKAQLVALEVCVVEDR
jgi:hypothetical protein